MLKGKYISQQGTAKTLCTRSNIIVSISGLGGFIYAKYSRQDSL